jgi:hypothetical protein
MIKKHIVLFETKDHNWIAYSTKGSDAKQLLNVNKDYNIFYIFECDLLKKYPYTMKLKTPLNNYYDCKNIIKYKEEIFEQTDNYIIIKYEDDNGICFDVNQFIYE